LSSAIDPISNVKSTTMKSNIAVTYRNRAHFLRKPFVYQTNSQMMMFCAQII